MVEQNKIGFISGGIPNISPKEAYQLCIESAIIIDIRPDYVASFKKFDVDKILYFPINNCDFTYGKLDKNKTYIIAETSTSENSREIVKKLIKKGFEKVYNLSGGFVEWERDNMPLKTNIKERLTGSCMCQLKPREK